MTMEYGTMAENGMPDNGYPVTGLPVGFAMSLAMNEKAMHRYAQLTESEKEEIIMKCRDASDKEEIRKIVDSLVPDGNMQGLFEGPKQT